MNLERAPVIGRVGPRADGRDRPYWEGVAAGRLLIQHCAACAAWVWPAQVLCPACHRFDPPWEEVPALGTVYSWTRTWQRFTAEFAELVPYVTIVVELTGAGGTRLLGLVLGDGDIDPAIGEPVRGTFQAASALTGGVAVLRWMRAGPRDLDTGAAFKYTHLETLGRTD